jgi:hypothetical protein
MQVYVGNNVSSVYLVQVSLLLIGQQGRVWDISSVIAYRPLPHFS